MGSQQRRLARKSLRRIAFATLLPWLLAPCFVHAQQTGGTPIDIAAGARRAAVCFACHNANGISRMPGVPDLAGQDRDYLEHALRDYRGGQIRKDPTMNAMAQPLSDRDIANIAAYFSSLPRSGESQAKAGGILAFLRRALAAFAGH